VAADPADRVGDGTQHVLQEICLYAIVMHEISDSDVRV
jgi:hypothetical protein